VADTGLYLQHQDVIERAIAFVCRRHYLCGPDAEDLASIVRLHLLERDCAVLKGFGGRSSVQTFLVAVVTHQFQDWRNARWGKWRESAEAQRMGKLAMALERLLVRDGLSMDEAVETLQTNHGVTDSRQVFEAMAARFPARPRRTFVGSEVLGSCPAPDSPPHGRLDDHDAADAARRTRTALDGALGALADQDRLILKMRFVDGESVATISRLLRLDQKALYRRMEGLRRHLRSALEATGVTASDATNVLARHGFDLADDDAPPMESPRRLRLFSRRSRPGASGWRAS
jgi:RNA polymerase sigma factor (sigma-70 family)